MNAYHKGQLVRLYTSSAFAVSGVATDPTTVTLKVEDPSGLETLYTYAAAEVTKSATGSYYKDITLNIPGVYHYAWIGTGAVVAADEEMLSCKNTVFA